MRIVFDGRVLKHLNYSGVENYTKYIAHALKKEISYTLLEPTSNNNYIQQLWEHFKLPFLSKNKDILFSPVNIAPILLPKKISLVVTLHDVAFKTFPGSVSPLFYWYYSILIPINLKRANRIITISESSKHEIIKFYPYVKKKISVIPLGVDESYKVLPSIRKKNQILYVGSFNERKNIIGVIEAFELLSRDFNYTLVIVGNISYNFKISAKLNIALNRAKENKNIFFKDNLDNNDLIKEYNISKCLIFPSFYEGFGLPPLEAMACGTPVITSNLSSMPEVCGDAVLYVDPYDKEDIKEKMEQLLRDSTLQNYLIKKGLERVGQFTWKRAAKEHIEVFKKSLHKENY